MSSIEVSCVEWAPDGSQLVSGNADNKVKLWSMSTENASTPWQATGTFFVCSDMPSLRLLPALSGGDCPRRFLGAQMFSVENVHVVEISDNGLLKEQHRHETRSYVNQLRIDSVSKYPFCVYVFLVQWICLFVPRCVTVFSQPYRSHDRFATVLGLCDMR